MAFNSALEAIEAAAVAGVGTVGDIADVSIIPAHEAFRVVERDGEQSIELQTLPKAYPGCVVSLAEREIKAIGGAPGPGSGWRLYRVPVWITLYAQSPSGGAVPGDAKYLAWKIAQAIQVAMIVTVPEKGGSSMVTPFEADEISTLPGDATTYGLMQIFTCDYQLFVKAEG